MHSEAETLRLMADQCRREARQAVTSSSASALNDIASRFERQATQSEAHPDPFSRPRLRLLD